MHRSTLLSAWLFCALCLIPMHPGHAQIASLDIERIQRATVLIMQASGEDLSITCVGSGTIVRYDGFILSNAHNTVQSSSCPGDTLIIAMSVNANDPPVPKYRAELVQVDEGLDLALLRISREFDGRVLEPESLPNLPFVNLASSEGIQLDQTLTMVGYPSLENDSVSSIRGTVNGFVAEPSGGDRSWIKINATEPIPGLMSGGGAYNQSGELVGLPTTAPVAIASTTCKRLEDSNGDGFINTDDFCVSIGDAITVLRPSDFAQPLLRSASLGLRVEALTTSDFQLSPADDPAIPRLFFAPSVNNGQPSTVVGRLPTGSNSLYLFFDYVNMTPETVYELRVNINGVPSPQFSLPPVRWSGGRAGLWYIGSSGQPFPNGDYEFRLYINGRPTASQIITVGGPAQLRAAFTDVLFGSLDANSQFGGSGYILPTGGTATARFIYQNMQPGIPWTALWFYNNQEIARIQESWRAENQANGNYPMPITPQGGFQPGNYRLDLYIDGFLSATGEFIVAGAPGGALPQVFSNVRFQRANSPLEAPTRAPARTFPDGVNTLYASFDWQQIAPGTLWTMRWLVDNSVFYERTRAWNSAQSGNDFTTRVTAPDGLPDGTYRLELLINNVTLISEEITVGIGQLEIDRFAQAGGVQLRGRIIDAESGNGLQGVTFMLITEDYAVADFVWDREQLYAIATSDQQGDFEIDRPLELDTPYSVLITAEGYLPVSADGFSVEADNANPLEITIPLTRD